VVKRGNRPDGDNTASLKTPCQVRVKSVSMKHRLFISLFLFLLSFLSADQVTIHLLQTTDIHAVLTKEENNSGSWLKLASLIREVRERHGNENCILIDCGDTIQGTLIGALSRGEAAIIPLKAMRYDAWIPGNHEFDFGFARFL
jgi:2',3'-cyclic-nucleotide 2'-phosphodiesterase/3'-nucleotidase